MRDRNRERDERKEARIFQCGSLFSFFLAPKARRQLSPPKHSGAELILPGAGHSCSSQGETGCCLA